MTTNEYIRKVKEHGWPAFDTKLWQRNYYEHIIRTDAVLNSIRGYIGANASQWKQDLENPYFTNVMDDWSR
jgi:REP-associated tyrosine transposase